MSAMSGRRLCFDFIHSAVYCGLFVSIIGRMKSATPRYMAMSAMALPIHASGRYSLAAG